MNDDRRHVPHGLPAESQVDALGPLPAPPAELAFDQVRLRFVRLVPGDPVRGFVPCYHFRIVNADEEDVGHINFRVGDTDRVYYVGHIGFEIGAGHRGHGFAWQACRALAPFVRTQYASVTITSDPENIASIRTIERLGATFLEEVAIPPPDSQFLKGSRRKNRYEWRP